MNTQTVMIVEDEEIGDDLVKCFDTKKGDWKFNVCKVKSLEELGQALSGNIRYDLAIIDMNLPNQIADWPHMNNAKAGTTALVIRESSPFCHIVVYTAYPTLENCILAMRGGAHDFVDKAQCDPVDLVDRVVRDLEQREAELNEQIRIQTQLMPKHRDWLTQKRGKWVAIEGDEIIVEGNNKIEVILQIWRNYPETYPQIIHIP